MRSRFLVCFGMSAYRPSGPGLLRSGGGALVRRVDESMYRAMAFDFQRAKGNAPRSWHLLGDGLRRSRVALAEDSGRRRTRAFRAATGG